MVLATSSHSPASARRRRRLTREPTAAGLEAVSVICWPTTGARLVGKARRNASICRRSASPSGPARMPLLPAPLNSSEKLIPWVKRNTVSTLQVGSLEELRVEVEARKGGRAEEPG